MRGQAAVEWMVLLSVAILTLALMLSFNEDNLRFFQDNARIARARASVSDLKNAADFVYSQGQDSMKTVYVTFPAASNFSIRTLENGGGEIEARVYVRGERHDIQEYTMGNLSGLMPDKAGGYCMEVRYEGGAIVMERGEGSCS
jgi:hypothetical protein